MRCGHSCSKERISHPGPTWIHNVDNVQLVGALFASGGIIAARDRGVWWISPLASTQWIQNSGLAKQGRSWLISYFSRATL